MGMKFNLLRLNEEELRSIQNDPSIFLNNYVLNGNSKEEQILDMDKSWGGVFYILTGKSMEQLREEPTLVAQSLFISQIVSPELDLGYGPVMYRTTEQVQEISNELEKLSISVISERIDLEEMEKLMIYPMIWSEPNSKDFLIESFKELKEFYKKTSKLNEAIITYLT